MKLTEQQKEVMHKILDSEEFKKTLYEGLPTDKRKALGQFYTPAKVIIMMLEKAYDDSITTLAGKTILDPTCGSGNLLIGCLCVGADLDKLYGNEYDPDAVKLCKKRLLRAAEILGLDTTKFNSWQIHQGNALQAKCLTDFSAEYDANYDIKYIDDLKYAQKTNAFGQKLTWLAENTEAKARNTKMVQTSLFGF